METIDHKMIEGIRKDKNSKLTQCKDCSDSMLQFVYSNYNAFEYIKGSFMKYELALWIKSNELYIKRKKTFHNNKYSPRDIIWVDFGSNVGNELSYEHPCIVIKNTYEKVFVVPCSSSKVNKIFDKNGNVYPEFMLGEQKDGFTTKTAILLMNARWISKSRILKKHTNQVGKVLYNEIYENLFGIIFESRQYTISAMDKKIKSLNEQIEKLKSENDVLKAQKH